MYKTVSENEFIQAFKDYNREGNFSIDGLKALYEYFEEYEEDTGEHVGLDVIAICVDFTEYENFKEFKDSHPDEDIQSIEDLEEYTQVIRITGLNTDTWEYEEKGFIIQYF